MIPLAPTPAPPPVAPLDTGVLATGGVAFAEENARLRQALDIAGAELKRLTVALDHAKGQLLSATEAYNALQSYLVRVSTTHPPVTGEAPPNIAPVVRTLLIEISRLKNAGEVADNT